MSLTVEQLAAACGTGLSRAASWLPHLEQPMAAHGIDTPRRIAAFLAQIGHESGHLRFVRELWGPTPAQARYEGRADLGNTQPGDGKRYLGRGLIQITGRANYRAAGQALGLPLEEYPDLLETMKHAAESAAWFWGTHDLNRWADAGDIDGVSDVINRGRKTQAIGDANGYADRLALYRAGMEVLA